MKVTYDVLLRKLTDDYLRNEEWVCNEMEDQECPFNLFEMLNSMLHKKNCLTPEAMGSKIMKWLSIRAKYASAREIEHYWSFDEDGLYDYDEE